MTTRGASGAFVTATQAEIIRPALLVEMDWPSGTSYVTNADHNITWNGNTYLGVGDLGQISEMREGADTQADVCTLSLSGINAAAVSRSITDDPQNRPCYIRLALFDANWQLIIDPVIIFAGSMDTPEFAFGSDGTISVPVVSRLADWERPRGGRFTDVEQQNRFTGDIFFQNVATLVNATIIWGAK